jgi:hypothetical protein
MDPHYPPSTKRLGVPDLLDWEASDQKRARLGLGEESQCDLESLSFDLVQPNECPDGEIPPSKLNCAPGSLYQVFDGNSEAADVLMGGVCAARDDHVVGLDDNGKLSEPPVETVCFGMVCRISCPHHFKLTLMQFSYRYATPKASYYMIQQLSKSPGSFLSRQDRRPMACGQYLDTMSLFSNLIPPKRWMWLSCIRPLLALSPMSPKFRAVRLICFSPAQSFGVCGTSSSLGRKEYNLLFLLSFTAPRKQLTRLADSCPKLDYISKIRCPIAKGYQDTTTLTD